MIKVTKEEYLKLLKNCGLLLAFQTGSGILINNFLHDLNDDRVRLKAVDEKGNIYYEKNAYFPIDTATIKDLIKLDNLLRMSTLFNDKPVVVYRGNPTLTEGALSGIVSTSLDVDVAKEFYKGSLIKMEIPAEFPHIFMSDVTDNKLFKHEKEVILPPCNFKVSGTFIMPHDVYADSYPVYYKGFVVRVEERNLAKTMLERMKKPPKDYEFGFAEQKREYKRAMKLLEDYIKNYVNKNKFMLEEELKRD